MPTVWKFVDSPTASPSVFLDMNDGVAMKTLGGDFFSIPSPPLRQSFVTNPMNDGAQLSSSAYDNRVLSFTLELTGSSETARIAQLTALKAELSKPTNLLMYQSQLASYPVFFRTMRSDEYTVDNQFVPGQAWRVSCTVTAEPYAIGVRRDLSAVTVTNDPANGTNPARFDITGIVGDSPTPAFVQLSGLGAGGTAILAQRTINSPTALTHFAQAESATLGTDTTTWSNAAMSGGSGTSTTFGTTGLVTRLTLTIPTASSAAALRGRYRVWARVHTGGTSADYVIRYVQNPGAGQDSINGPSTPYHATTTWEHIDLGVIDFPAIPMPSAVGYSGLAPGAATASLAIQASRSGGLDNLDIDYVALMPADERSCEVHQVTAVNSLILDGPADMAYGLASGSTPFGATRVVDNLGGLTPRTGGFPMLVPGVTNRWYLLVAKGAITATTTVTVSYWPRWREVATS